MWWKFRGKKEKSSPTGEYIRACEAEIKASREVIKLQKRMIEIHDHIIGNTKALMEMRGIDPESFGL